MFFGKKPHLVGLDIGSRTIKAAEVVETKKGRALKNFNTINIEPGIIEEGAIKDPEAVSAAIRELFKNSKRESEQNPNQMSVILVAAKKEMVSEYVSLIQMAGLNACIIDVDAFALQNIFEFNYAPEEENVALIDIGASKTSLNLLKGNSSVFMRDVSLGCGQINEKISSFANCSLEEADEIKLSRQSDKVSVEDLKGIVSTVVTDWCSEIKRALDFFYSSYPEDQIKRIILSGGGANIIEFRKLLAEETATAVEIINPFGNFSVDNRSLDDSYLEQIAPQAAICMGIAIRKMGDK
jgi:type IV pilus assembly protein PilM